MINWSIIHCGADSEAMSLIEMLSRDEDLNHDSIRVFIVLKSWQSVSLGLRVSTDLNSFSHSTDSIVFFGNFNRFHNASSFRIFDEIGSTIRA